MNAKRLAEQLLLHEGLKEKAYRDTLGFWTVGVGYNLAARGKTELERVIGRSLPSDYAQIQITKGEALCMLNEDIRRIERRVVALFPTYLGLDEVRQRVVMDMAFNMGTKTLGFVDTIDAIKKQDWPRVSRNLFRSRWARQVDDGEGGRFGRADRLAKMMLTGQDYVV